ncbi:hypothetical protein SprV_0100026800 [Sparganum proliferum]
MVRQLHDVMIARVTNNGAIAGAFAGTSGVKQGCVLALTLFILMFSGMLMEAYRDERPGTRIYYRADGPPFQQPPNPAPTRLPTAIIHDLLFDDECVLSIPTILLYRAATLTVYAKNAPATNPDSAATTVTVGHNAALPPPPSIDIIRIASALATAAATSTSTVTMTSRTPPTAGTTAIFPPTSKSNDVDLVHACCPCDRTFTSRISLVGCLRIHRIETDESVPGAPTYACSLRLHCPHCSRPFTHTEDFLGHLRIHDSGIRCSLDRPTTFCTFIMPRPNQTTWLNMPNVSKTTATIDETDPDTADLTCPNCPRTLT